MCSWCGIISLPRGYARKSSTLSVSQCFYESDGNVRTGRCNSPWCSCLLIGISLVLAVDSSTALTLLLRYPSPHPYAPQSFVYDAIYLDQNPTTERGKFIISKYSGKPPEASRRLGARPVPNRRAQLLGDWKDMNETNAFSKSPRSSSRGLETIFQDVSEGIQRRTESWGVAKAVCGAVNEARKNMQSIQSEGYPRMRYGDSSSFSARNSASWSQKPETAELRERIDHLEERNRILAKSLSQSLNDLRSQMMNMNVGKVDPQATAAMKQTLTRVQSVQTCLEDPSAFLQSTTDMEAKEPRKQKTEQSSTAFGSTEQSSRSSSSTSDRSSRPGPRKPGGPTSMPLRQSPRPSLANSEFSWMLGGHGNRNLSGFVSSASEPPEQARQQNQTLFGTDEEKTKRSPVEPDGLAMRSLSGPESLE